MKKLMLVVSKVRSFVANEHIVNSTRIIAYNRYKLPNIALAILVIAALFQGGEPVITKVADVFDNPIAEFFTRIVKNIVKVSIALFRFIGYATAMYITGHPWSYLVLTVSCAIELAVYFNYFKKLEIWVEKHKKCFSVFVLIGYSISALHDPLSHMLLLSAVGLETYNVFKK